MDENKKNGTAGTPEANTKRVDSGHLALGMCIGLALGTAIGAATGSLALWLPIGLALGTGLGFALDMQQQKTEPEKSAADDAGEDDPDETEK